MKTTIGGRQDISNQATRNANVATASVAEECRKKHRPVDTTFHKRGEGTMPNKGNPTEEQANEAERLKYDWRSSDNTQPIRSEYTW